MVVHQRRRFMGCVHPLIDTAFGAILALAPPQVTLHRLLGFKHSQPALCPAAERRG